jgi:DNA-binding transcriptional MerR regulator
MSEASAALRIGDLARITGVSVRSLRYYEQQGLLAPVRSASGQRLYPVCDADRVALVVQLLAAGLGTVKIAELLPCIDAPPSERTGHLLASLRAEARRVDDAVANLADVRHRLQAVIDDIEADSGRPRP